MGRRLILHQILCNLLGTPNAYFQPPETIKMNYPCIVYRRTSADTRFSNDFPYLCEMSYQVTVIDKDPDSALPIKVSLLQKCIFQNHFVKDNLNHDVYNIYY